MTLFYTQMFYHNDISKLIINKHFNKLVLYSKLIRGGETSNYPKLFFSFIHEKNMNYYEYLQKVNIALQNRQCITCERGQVVWYRNIYLLGILIPSFFDNGISHED